MIPNSRKGQHSKLSRRKFLHTFSSIVGGTAATAMLAGNGFSVAFAYQAKTDSTKSAGKVFSQVHMALLKEVCQLVIPKTDTLGAGDVDTHGFIDNQLHHCYPPLRQEAVKDVLLFLEKQHFSALSEQKKFDILSQLDNGVAEIEDQQKDNFRFLKYLICFGYYTSEVGASQELRYAAVPGGFKGSVPYDGTQAAWGSLGLFY